jgi:hypothetical protein
VAKPGRPVVRKGIYVSKTVEIRVDLIRSVEVSKRSLREAVENGLLLLQLLEQVQESEREDR